MPEHLEVDLIVMAGDRGSKKCSKLVKCHQQIHAVSQMSHAEVSLVCDQS